MKKTFKDLKEGDIIKIFLGEPYRSRGEFYTVMVVKKSYTLFHNHPRLTVAGFLPVGEFGTIKFGKISVVLCEHDTFEVLL